MSDIARFATYCELIFLTDTGKMATKKMMGAKFHANLAFFDRGIVRGIDKR